MWIHRPKDAPAPAAADEEIKKPAETKPIHDRLIAEAGDDMAFVIASDDDVVVHGKSPRASRL